MNEEFNLSEKIKQLDEMIELEELNTDFSSISERQLVGVYKELKKDIKEFIRLLKEEFDINYKQVWGINQIKEIIDKLAGDKLVEKEK